MDADSASVAEEDAGVKLAWVCGYKDISLNNPSVWLCLGVRGAGKSAFLEHLGEQHLENGNCVLDLFAARSGESLAWLRSKWAREKRVLLLHAENAVVEAPGSVEAKPVNKLCLADFEDYDLIINSCVLYPNLDAEFEAVNSILDRLWMRRHWHRLIYVICREAANIMYSRMKITENQTLAKAYLTYWLRESRHTGCSLALDSQRFMALDVDIRSLADYIVLKAQGASTLPRDMYFIYRYVDPKWLQYANPHEFVLLTRRGDIAIGVSPLPEWHAREGEDIPGKVKIKVAFENQPEEGRKRGRYKTIGDIEHAQIVQLYIEEKHSMNRIAEHLKRSACAIKKHLDKHDMAIDRLGYCPKCRRAKGKYEAAKAKQDEV